ncbi:MAG: twin-arginine translocase TatA/TatE family subunit [Arcobacter sp.]|uniref:twin-arginine translocase TatA/TatE family subunit n=1 Tax=Arcobacter sp. TaxID=1872629 RepID=UPI0025837296|nr:twin-arginine translocase TatA/TatE family subunit [Arcobacter sp.]MDD3009535.1 twin-arginine translocase TatA/TatE family subunit [Arcobacter sp.]MDY3204828.1 twin-arginine translocase TatA/TatE family subunit [Arcobacter sp.]
MFHMPSGMQLVVIMVVILLFFGGKKIPELAKGLGSGIKNFKKAISDDDTELQADAKTVQTKDEERKI